MDEVPKKMDEGRTVDFQNAFVGREKEFNQLRKQFKKSQSGNGKCLLIRGEAGIGKNKLVRHFVEDAISKGSVYVHERFKESDAFNPYSPFIKIVDKLESSGIENNFIAPLNKDKQASDNRVTEFLYDVQNERSVLQQRIIAALASASRDESLIIEFTDIHLAPLTSWQFIHYLAQNILDQKIIVILTLRQDGRETQRKDMPVYADVLQRMNRQGFLEIINLNRFNKSNVRQLLNYLFPRSDFSSSFIPMLHEISGGLPDQLLKILESMMFNRDIYRQNNIWFNKENINREYLIFLISDAHEKERATKQLLDFSDVQTEINKYAALMDPVLDTEVLSKVVGISKVKLIKELNILKDGKIFTEDDEGNYKFKRPIFRSLILEQITSNEKQDKQERIIETLEDLYATNNQEIITQLAFFSNQIDNSEKSFKYSCEAGNYAIRKLAFIEAQEFYNNALQKMPSVFDTWNCRAVISLLLKAAWLDRVLGNWIESLSKCKMAREFCDGYDVNLRNQILIQEGLTYFRLSDWKNSSNSFHTALLNPESVSLYDKAMATYGLGNIFFETSQYEESKNYYHQALKIAEELGSHSLRANIFNNLGAIESIRGNRLKAIALYSQGIPLFKQIGDNYGLARLYNNIGMTYAEEKDWSKANEFYGKSLSISDTYGLALMKSITFLNRALAKVFLNHFDEAKEYNFKAFRLLTQLKDELGLAEYYKIQGILERVQENWAEAKKDLQIALEKYDMLQNQLGCAESQYELGILALAESNWDEVNSWFHKAIESYKNLGISDKVKSIEKQLEQFQVSQTVSQEMV